MPRYLIERNWGKIDEADLAEVGERNRLVLTKDFPDLSWERSDVVSDEEGVLKTFCMYTAPNAERLYEHATELGGHVVDTIYEVGGTVSPQDFPS